MFGEIALLGQMEQTLDNKTRLILPVSTKREAGEKVVIIEDKDLNIFRIYSENKIINEYENLNEELNKAKTKEDEIKLKMKILELSKSIVKCLKVDKTGKITLGSKFIGQTNVTLIGANDHLILELKK